MVRAMAAAAVLTVATMGFGLSHARAFQPPPAAQPPVAPGNAAGDPAKGKELFTTWACGTCHILADAGADGQVGPPLDNDPNLSETLVVSRIANGQGAMPAFGGQMTEEEIADVTAYIMKASKK